VLGFNAKVGQYPVFQPPASSLKPLEPNRDTERLETAVTQRKQRTGRSSNRDKNAVLQNAIGRANDLDRRHPRASGHRFLIGNQTIRSRGNSKKTNDGAHV
jgi:hypothetical protein